MALIAKALTHLQDLEQILSADPCEPERRRMEVMGYYGRPEYTLPEAIILLAREDAARFGSSQEVSDDEDVCKGFRTILEQHNKEGPESVSAMDQDLFDLYYRLMTARVLKRAHIVLATLKDSVCDDLVEFYKPDVITVDQAARDLEDHAQITINTYSAAKRIILVDDDPASSSTQTCLRKARKVEAVRRWLQGI